MNITEFHLINAKIRLLYLKSYLRLKESSGNWKNQKRHPPGAFDPAVGSVAGQWKDENISVPSSKGEAIDRETQPEDQAKVDNIFKSVSEDIINQFKDFPDVVSGFYNTNIKQPLSELLSSIDSNFQTLKKEETIHKTELIVGGLIATGLGIGAYFAATYGVASLLPSINVSLGIEALGTGAFMEKIGAGLSSLMGLKGCGSNLPQKAIKNASKFLIPALSNKIVKTLIGLGGAVGVAVGIEKTVDRPHKSLIQKAKEVGEQQQKEINITQKEIEALHPEVLNVDNKKEILNHAGIDKKGLDSELTRLKDNNSRFAPKMQELVLGLYNAQARLDAAKKNYDDSSDVVKTLKAEVGWRKKIIQGEIAYGKNMDEIDFLWGNTIASNDITDKLRLIDKASKLADGITTDIKVKNKDKKADYKVYNTPEDLNKASQRISNQYKEFGVILQMANPDLKDHREGAKKYGEFISEIVTEVQTLLPMKDEDKIIYAPVLLDNDAYYAFNVTSDFDLVEENADTVVIPGMSTQLSKNRVKTTTFHETGHAFEVASDSVLQSYLFTLNRAKKDPKTNKPIEKPIAPGSNLIIVDTDFYDSYAGKSYAKNPIDVVNQKSVQQTEVMSTAVESFADRIDLVNHIYEDRQHILYAIGAMIAD